MRMMESRLTEEEKEQMAKDLQIMEEKYQQAEKSKIKVQFFNKGAIKMLEKSKSIEVKTYNE